MFHNGVTMSRFWACEGVPFWNSQESPTLHLVTGILNIAASFPMVSNSIPRFGKFLLWMEHDSDGWRE